MEALKYLYCLGLEAESLPGDQVAIWPEDAITPEIEKWIIQHKLQLVTELRLAANVSFTESLDGIIGQVCDHLSICPGKLRALLSDEDLDQILSGEVDVMCYAELMLADGWDLTTTTVTETVSVPIVPSLADRIRSLPVPLLMEDVRYLEQLLSAVPSQERTSLMERYCQQWHEAASRESTLHHRDNAGRRAANSWIRRAVTAGRRQTIRPALTGPKPEAEPRGDPCCFMVKSVNFTKDRLAEYR